MLRYTLPNEYRCYRAAIVAAWLIRSPIGYFTAVECRETKKNDKPQSRNALDSRLACFAGANQHGPGSVVVRGRGHNRQRVAYVARQTVRARLERRQRLLDAVVDQSLFIHRCAWPNCNNIINEESRNEEQEPVLRTTFAASKPFGGGVGACDMFSKNSKCD